MSHLVLLTTILTLIAAYRAAAQSQINKRTDGLLTAILTGRAVDVMHTTFGSMLTSLDTCFFRPAWSDPVLGTFSADPIYCDSRCLRSVLCCSPERVDELQVQFILTRAHDPLRSTPITPGDFKKLKDSYSNRDAAGGSNRTLTVIVHGFLNHFSYESMWNQTRDAFLKRGTDVVTVDWSRGNRLYPQSMANVRVVGALIGRLISSIGMSGRTYCIGFSLGAHVCGEAGAWLRHRSLTPMPRCTGIDPAGPGFDGCGPDVRLDPSDCTVVTAIHTSQFVDMLGFGTRFKTGHCDFWYGILHRPLSSSSCLLPLASVMPASTDAQDERWQGTAGV